MDDTTLNISRLQRETVKLSQINVALGVELSVAIFVRNLALLLLLVIVVIPPIINTIPDDSPVDNSISVPPHTHYIAFSQWASFGILLGKTPGEKQTFLLLRFLKSSHDLSPVTKYLKNGISSFRGRRIRTRSVWLQSESSSSSQFPHFSKLFEVAHSCCHAFIPFHHCQKYLIIKIGRPTSSWFMFQACVASFQAEKSLLTLLFANCLFAKKIVENCCFHPSNSGKAEYDQCEYGFRHALLLPKQRRTVSTKK